MESSRLASLDVRHITKNQPFCAGIILIHNGKLVVTLNTDGLPSSLAKGLLLLIVEQWSLLQQRPDLETMLQHGAQIIENEPLPSTHLLWVHPHEPMGIVATLLMKHTDLLQR